MGEPRPLRTARAAVPRVRRWRSAPFRGSATDAAKAAASRAWRCWDAGLTTRLSTRYHAGTCRAGGHAGLRARRGVHEVPLVVLAAAVVEPDRRRLALAGHANQATGGSSLERAGGARTDLGLPEGRGTAATVAWAGAGYRRGDRAGLGRGTLVQHLEITARDRVLVALSKELLVEQHIEIRGKRAGELALEQPDGARVLFASPDELRFPLALHLLAPRGHGRGHENSHDGNRDEQRCHRMAGFPAPVHVLTS